MNKGGTAAVSPELYKAIMIDLIYLYGNGFATTT